MNFITVIVPYLPCSGNTSLKFTLDKFYANSFSNSISVNIHIQMTLVPNIILLPCIDLVKQYQGLFLSQYNSLSLTFDSSYDTGIYDAINLAVKNSDSEFVAVCGAGDYFYLSTIEKFRLAISYHDISIFPVKFLSNNSIYNQPSRSMLPFKNICHQGMIFKRSVLSSLPYSLRYPILSDYHWNLIYLDLHNIARFKTVVAVYDDTCGLSVSNQRDSAFIHDKFNIICTNYNLFFSLTSLLWYYLIAILKYIFK